MSKRALVMVFVICALPVCFSTALLTPPGQSPDEPAHIVRAEGLLRGAILGVRKRSIDPQTNQPEMLSGVIAPLDVFFAAFGISSPAPGRVTPIFTSADMAKMRAQPRNEQLLYISIPNTVVYFPAAYVPAALGIGLGRLLRAPPFECIMLARLAAALAFVALGALALSLAAYGEAVLLTVLLMPMTLFLASTENQDGMLIAMVCLACALLSRGARMPGLAMLALVLAAKPPYLFLMGVFLLPLGAPDLLRRSREIAFALVPVLVWMVLVTLFVVEPIHRPLYHPGPLFSGDRTIWMDHTAAAVNLRILLGKPSLLLTLPLHSLAINGALYWWEMIGMLANLAILLPEHCYWAWDGALVCAVAGLLASPRPDRSLVDCGFVWILLGATVWAVLISFYPLWTNAGGDDIDGPQGRYFLLVMPFLLFAVPSWRSGWRMPPLLPALPAVALGLYDLGFLPVTLISSFYVH